MSSTEQRTEPSGAASRLPFISIVVPTFRRPEKVGQLLTSLCVVDYPRDRFELVLVDDGGGIDLEPTIGPFRDRLDVVLLVGERGGPASARQAGVERARGTVLAFTDDDCVPRANWLAVVADASARYPGCGLGGHVQNGLPANPFSDASQLLIGYLCEGNRHQVGPAGFFTTNNVAFPAEQLAAVGGMDPTWSISGGEDRDLFDRWAQAGNGLIHVPEMVVHHHHPLSIASFWRKHFNYGRGAFAFRKVHANRRKQRLRLGPPVFYLRVPALPFGRYPWPRALVRSCLLALSQVATAAGFLAQAASWQFRGAAAPQDGPIGRPRRSSLQSTR
jgi:glycosyltransferase involved in cell wall biosynthesis